MAWVRKPYSLFKTNISLNMVQEGLAIVYTSANAQYGDILESLERGQDRAKKNKVGMWKQGKKFVRYGISAIIIDNPVHVITRSLD